MPVTCKQGSVCYRGVIYAAESITRAYDLRLEYCGSGDGGENDVDAKEEGDLETGSDEGLCSRIGDVQQNYLD